jgi:hypothetical protein
MSSSVRFDTRAPGCIGTALSDKDENWDWFDELN